MRDIQSIRIQVKEGLFPRRILYMEIRGQGAIPLTRTDEKFFTPREIEQKAAELAYFLRIPMEVFWVPIAFFWNELNAEELEEEKFSQHGTGESPFEIALL